MEIDCSCGFSYYLRGHLWVVIAELQESPPMKVVAVSLTTKKSGSDTTVVFKKGDHPFINHPTVINYTDARVWQRDVLINRINEKFFSVGQPFHRDKVKQMQEGLLRSTFTSNDIKALCREAFKDK